MLTEIQDIFSAFTVDSGGFNCRQNHTSNNWVIQTLCMLRAPQKSIPAWRKAILKQLSFYWTMCHFFVWMQIGKSLGRPSYVYPIQHCILKYLPRYCNYFKACVNSERLANVTLQCSRVHTGYIHLFVLIFTANETVMPFGYSHHLDKFQLW